MAKKRELHLHIGLAVRNDGVREPIAVCESFLETFDRSPLNWVLASGAALEKRSAGRDRLVAEIKARLARIGDTVIPAGYGGAPHPLLGVNEVSRELEWSIRNPWKSGVYDVFRKQPDVLIPAWADFNREKVVELYRRQGFRFLGAPLPQGSPVYRFRGEASGDGITVFHYLCLDPRVTADPTRLARSFFPRDLDRLFLLVAPDGPETLAALISLIEALRQRRDLVIAAFESPAETPPPAGERAPRSPSVPAAIADTPLLRSLRDQAARLRAKTQLKDSEMRDLLLLTAGEPHEAEKARSELKAKPAAREGTAYTANMPGEILLPGNGFDAFFSGGRLSDLRTGGASLLPSGAPRAWAALGGREAPLPFDRVFSFEKNDLRGLEAFVLFPGSGHEHSFTLRYAFSGEIPWLLISGLCLGRPSSQLERIAAVAPLEIPVGACSPEAPLEITRLYADGSSAKTVFTGADVSTTLAGTVFSVARPGMRLVFGYVAHKSEPVGLLEARVVPGGKKGAHRPAAVCINPFGTYRAEAVPEMFAVGESRSFYIGVKSEEPDRMPSFSAALTKSIPVHAVFKIQER
ncbi:MAG: hypothetical protein JXD23_14750 [Spirochaetales bacterium]|nr:hypothetical protein [Spirochaetales bacterium]